MRRREGARWLTAASIGAALWVAAPGGPAAAQLLGRALSTPGQLLSGLPLPLSDVTNLPQTATTLLTERLRRIDAMLRAHPRELERDERGSPVVRGEILAVGVDDTALERARRDGFEIKADAGETDLSLVVLKAPPGMSARDALRRLRRLDPAGTYDFNHIYAPSGAASAEQATGGGGRVGATPIRDLRIGMIDAGVDTRGAVLSRARIEQRAFAGALKPSAHGTAVASLLVGEDAGFRSAVPGAQLYAADVYGGRPTGGAADGVVRAFGWLLEQRVSVISISLVGPPNAAVAAAVRLADARSVAVVAPVGNDGPAAPPAYPASFPSVVAVTGVDARGRVLIEAGRASHLDFAAPGADLAAAAPGGGYIAVRGTSFAAPLAAGRLGAAMAGRGVDPKAAVALVARDATKGSGYGRGLVAMDLRTPPSAVSARSSAAR